MKQQFIDQLNKVGLSRISKDLADLMKFSVRMESEEAEENDISIGKSKLGGTPDLPKDWNWPQWKDKYLSFICQINLQDLDIDNIPELPGHGILYFFYEAEEQPWGFDPSDKGCCKVLFYDGIINSDTLGRTAFPEALPDECKFISSIINFNTELTMPSSDSIYIEKLRLNENESNVFSKLEELEQERTEGETIHRLLGYPDAIQGEMETECALVVNGLYCGNSSGYESSEGQELMKTAEDWKLLLQIDSDDEAGFTWGDMGRVYFWIHKDDLKNQNFDNVWAILQCY